MDVYTWSKVMWFTIFAACIILGFLYYFFIGDK